MNIMADRPGFPRLCHPPPISDDHAMRRILSSFICILSALPFGHAHADAADDAMARDNQQRQAAVLADIGKTALQDRAILVKGSLRFNVFGPEATIAFYTLAGIGGTQRQYMVVLEKQLNSAAGEVAPPLPAADLALHFYSDRQVVVGHARIGGQGWRTLDVAHAAIDEVRDVHDDEFALRATVTLPVVGAHKPVVYRITHSYASQLATIAETSR